MRSLSVALRRPGQQRLRAPACRHEGVVTCGAQNARDVEAGGLQLGAEAQLAGSVREVAVAIGASEARGGHETRG